MGSAYGISNCVAWYLADTGVYSDAGSTLCSDGQAVYQWNDQSGAGNHLVQSNSSNRPLYNSYTTAVPAGGPTAISPYGQNQGVYQASLAKSVMFDGSTSYLNIPGSLALPGTGATVLICSRGMYYSPISFGTDGTNTINYGNYLGTPPHLGIYNGGLRSFPLVTHLPVLAPIVHGVRFSAALGESRLYLGTNQQSVIHQNWCNFNVSGGAVGRTLNLSAGGAGNCSFNGEISEIAVFSTPLTDAQMQTVITNMQITNRIRPDGDSSQVIFLGDSLTAGGPGTPIMSHNYPWVLCQQYGGSFKPLMLATPGDLIADQQGFVNSVLAYMDLTPFSKNVAIICCGANDLKNGRTTTQVLTDLTSLCQSVRSLGIKVIVTTITLNGTISTAPFITVNNAIASGWSSFADGFVDFAGDARLADPTNTAYFTDELHTNDTGDALKAALVKPALDALLYPPASNQAVLSRATFYAGGSNFAGQFGNFVKA